MAKRQIENLEEKIARWKAKRARVSMRQARLALIQFGVIDQVESTIQAMDEPDRSIARTEWEYAQFIERSSPWVQKVSDQAGLTETQLDDLFAYAETL